MNKDLRESDDNAAHHIVLFAELHSVAVISVYYWLEQAP